MFIATQCITPPHAVERAVTSATRLVSERIVPISRPIACMNTTLGFNIAGMATAGVIYLDREESPYYRAPVAYWSYDIAETLLHEVIHQVGLSKGGIPVDLMWIEEGVTEAVASDLMPVFLRRLGALQNRGEVTYPTYVRAVRRASLVATGQPWLSPAARRWRISLLRTNPAERSIPLG